MDDTTDPRDDIDPPYSNSKPYESRRSESAQEVDKVLNFLSMRKDRGFDPSLSGNGSAKRDWSAALDLMNEAFEAMRMSEERAAEMEAQMEDLARRFNEESKASQARLLSAERRAEEAQARAWQEESRAKEAEARVKKAEASAKQAEDRADEAEQWLARFHDAVVKGFSQRRATASQAGVRRIEDAKRDFS